MLLHIFLTIPTLLMATIAWYIHVGLALVCLIVLFAVSIGAIGVYRTHLGPNWCRKLERWRAKSISTFGRDGSLLLLLQTAGQGAGGSLEPNADGGNYRERSIYLPLSRTVFSRMARQPGTHRTGIFLAADAVHTVVMSHDYPLRDLESDLVRDRERLHPV